MSDPSPPETSERERRLEEVLAALLAAEDAGQPLMRDVLLTQNADLADDLRAFLGAHDRVRVLAAPLRAVAASGSAAETTQRDPESTLAESPRPAGLTAEATETLGATIEPTTGPEDDPDATAPNTPNATVGRDRIEFGTRVRYFGDYELLNVLGRGGMGVVYKARQISLNRPVALKMLQAGVLATEGDLRRFQNEAEAVAMLDPHIVPILEVGQHEDQRYFSMKLIGGPSLDRKLSEFINDPKAAARLVRIAAEAVHHAHVRGILHRDLKPANVLLDERGEPHVTDFGLAKRVHADSDLTESGAILGTPPYMAPEQASGKRGMVTTATDVYGLGAILYALLTGRAPFCSDSPLETLEQVRERIPAPPSKHNPRVPRDLEVICLKCLEKQPERRYASAQALAEDLRRYLSSEAILARPVGLAMQAWMWCERNPALARLWFALILTLFLFLATWGGIAIVAIEWARRDMRSEAVARIEAETNFDMAQKAVEDYLTSVSENTLLKEQDSVDIRSLRHELLRSALTYYVQFANQRKKDPLLRSREANAYFRIGQITKEIDSHAKAIGAFRSAQAIWEPLFEANPKDHAVASNLGECYLAIGRLQSSDNNFPAAMNALSQSRAILERLRAENPSEARYQASLADCYSEIGIVHGSLDHPDQSLAIQQEARAIQQGLINQYPDKLAYRKSLAENINAIGYAYFKRLDNDAALKAFHEVQDICESIVKEVSQGPKPVWLLNLLALSQYNIGSIHKQSGAIEKALPFYEQSLRYRSALADSHPSVTQFQEKLAVSYREIAELQHLAHQGTKALQSAQKSIDVFTALVRAHPELARFHSGLGLSWNYVGVLHDEARNNAEAIRPFERAVSEQQLAIEKAEHAEVYKGYLCNHFDNLGEQYVDLGRVAEGVRFFQQANQIRRELNAAHPENRAFALDLAKALLTLGTIRRHEGDPGAARQLFAEAEGVVDRWLGTATDDHEFKVQLAVVLDNEANTMTDEKQPQKARSLLEQATALFRQLAADAAPARQGLLEREWRSEALGDLARVLRVLKLTTEADRVEAERIELWKARPPEELVALALKQTSRANLIGYGKTPVSAQAKAVRELDLDQAAGELRLAISRGFKDLRILKSHPDSAALLSRDDLAPALEDLAFPRNPFSDRR